MVFDPISITAITALITTATPHMLVALRGTLLDKGKEAAIDKSKEFLVRRGSKLVRDRVLHLDDNEQQKHLEQALKNALELGLASFHTLEEHDQYRAILKNLFEPGEHSVALQQETLRLFSFSDKPDLAKLNEAYNRSLRSRNLSAQKIPVVDAAPYLDAFFKALMTELYADPFFKQQMYDAIQMRAAIAIMNIQTSVVEVVALLRQMNTVLAKDYTAEQLEQDIQTYATHLESSLRYLKVAGVVPTKDRSDRHRDPELNGIFVPLRIELKGEEQPGRVKSSVVDLDDKEGISDGVSGEDESTEPDAVKTSLERFPYLVLLGGPGSGKSTITRHIAWSHAAANCAALHTSDATLLARRPLPLRIELRRLIEDRRRHEYDFLSYATEVILKREGVEINPQMFKELLARKSMVLLFDGLDEVATLDERRRLVEEIEGFALRYPGNYVLVTSRPVGYELAPISSQWFIQAEVQEFDDTQIRQFLERWYTHVLRLSPLPSDDRQELELLYKTLQDNARLHKLAVNPLLLTVITALHRYERLPDKRILVYDRCADLLLDTWARLKGTDIRWQTMRMSKDDQYACVAHLGYVLHKRSQEQANGNENNLSKDTDVPSRFLAREIEHFLNVNGLIKEVAEQRAEAKRFLDLMQVEAGLIVERGTGENDESLYGFVHRTFQEYFAAADVYTRYLQNEEPEIINEFLVEHLHDPHWQEVILLLLGKLGRKPLTARLQQILNGKIVSRRSHHTDILQQDLFFISSCLVEEMLVDSQFAESVASRLENVVKTSLIQSQRTGALKQLAQLMQTRQYTLLGKEKLIKIISEGVEKDIYIKIEIVRILDQVAPSSTEFQQSIQVILELLQDTSLSLKEKLSISRQLYIIFRAQPEIFQLITKVLLDLTKIPTNSIEQSVAILQTLYQNNQENLKIERKILNKLSKLLLLPNFPIEETLQNIGKGLQYTPPDELGFDTHLIRLLSTHSNITVDQTLNILGWNKLTQQANQRLLLNLISKNNLTVEQNIRVAQLLYIHFPKGSKEVSKAEQMFSNILSNKDLTIEQVTSTITRMMSARSLHSFKYNTQDEIVDMQDAKAVFVRLLRYKDLTNKELITIAGAMYFTGFEYEEQVAIQILLKLLQNIDLDFEHLFLIAETFYTDDRVDMMILNRNETILEIRETVRQKLYLLMQDEHVLNNKKLKIISIFLEKDDENYVDKYYACRALHAFLADEDAKNFIEEKWKIVTYTRKILYIPFILHLISQPILPDWIRSSLYNILQRLIPQFDKLLSVSSSLE